MDKKTGYCRLDENMAAKITDLPGTYSLYPKSADELVTYDLLRNEDAPDLILFIADASNLKRNLLLFTQVADLGVPVILALNMVDIAERKGIFYDIEVLSEKLGVSVIPINARNRIGIDLLRSVLADKNRHTHQTYFDLHGTSQDLLNEVTALTHKKTPYSALQYAINAGILLPQESAGISALFKKHGFESKAFQEKEILERYHLIDRAVRESRRQKNTPTVRSFTHLADKILTHRVGGILIFLATLFLVFQAIFSWSSYPMDWVEQGFAWISALVENVLPPGILSNLIVNGVLAGLSGVMVFLPQIIILFAFIAILEDVGYMARVGFMMDRIMRPFGMNGKSIVPLISGMACAVPSIMASRSIENKRERLVTILVTPLMSCSARLPVYTLLIALFVPDSATWGPFNLHGIILMAMYLLGFVAALLSALLLKAFVTVSQKNYFIMEMPGYKMPVWTNILITLYDKGKAFVVGAGKIIIAVSIILWALASFGPGNRMNEIEQKYETAAAQPGANLPDLEAQKNAERLEASFAGSFGKLIEPAIRPLGFDWKIGISLFTSLAAREVFVGTMSTIYSVGEQTETDNLASIKQKMLADKHADGTPVYTLASILSLMVFYAFAMQCMSTLSVVQTETKTWKWPLIQFFYMTALAYLSSLAVYHIFS